MWHEGDWDGLWAEIMSRWPIKEEGDDSGGGSDPGGRGEETNPQPWNILKKLYMYMHE